MAARDDKGKEGEFGGFLVWIFRGSEPVGVDVAFDVVDAIKGFVVEDGESASSEGADK